MPNNHPKFKNIKKKTDRAWRRAFHYPIDRQPFIEKQVAIIEKPESPSLEALPRNLW